MSLLLGLSCGIIPFVSHDHARRVLYQSQKHSQQAIGFPTTNPNIRVDTLTHQLYYPQRPLFRTFTAECLGKPEPSQNKMDPKPELYNGQNSIVAVNVHMGYNQEDSLVMNLNVVLLELECRFISVFNCPKIDLRASGLVYLNFKHLQTRKQFDFLSPQNSSPLLRNFLATVLLQISMEQQQRSPTLDDCLKLLKGERDEQRLAGLLLVTKFCKGDDVVSLRRVYDSVGVTFLDRLLRTGMSKGSVSEDGNNNRDAYLQLSVTVLAAFCRVPEIAASRDMVSKIPLILEVISMSSAAVLEECYELLYQVTASSEDGAKELHRSGGIKVLAYQLSSLPDGSRIMELAMKILQSVLNKLSLDSITNSYLSELSMTLVVIARQFAVSHNQLKFDALHLLSNVFSSKFTEALHDTLRSMAGNNWPDHMRVGIVAILQNRVAPAEKLHALILAESMMSLFGENWLIGHSNLPDLQESMPANRCLLLVLESSRVEVAVLLNELAYLKYETSKNTSASAETIMLKQRNVAIAFSLIERIIKLISSIAESEGELIDEKTFLKVINGLEETLNVVLEYLQDAKEHGQNKGDDLLASVRLVGSYLAETPHACKDKVRELLGYMLSIEADDEPSPFYSICFLLPMLCQITMNAEGCKALVSSGNYHTVFRYLVKVVGPSRRTVEDNSSIFLACDTIMNLLLKKEQARFSLDEATVVDLLIALGYWAENTDDASVVMMASSICALLFDCTSEDALLNHPNFSISSLGSLSRLMARSLAFSKQEMSDAVTAEMDLIEIVTSGFSRWAHRFPRVSATLHGIP
ncbi:neurochondrin family protein [Euphorbia peplus]|nr:neurochondrin family protein [Euphorbia peplus]